MLGGDEFTLRIFLDGQSFERTVEELPAGTILMSLNLPDRDCLDTFLFAAECRPDMPVIALLSKPGVPSVVKAMREGVIDFLEKPIDRALLNAALFHATHDFEPDSSWQNRQKMEEVLTKRQFEVLNLLVAGKQNKRIGVELGISERTVEIHRSKIMKQLQVANFATLIRLAIKAGIEPE